MQTLTNLAQKVIDCEKCTRLRKHCKKIATEKRKAFKHETYWGKPVPGFGDPFAKLIIIGLAPAAHGANRTGRIFTGDRSGLWLYRALYRAGFANQPESVSLQDGLKLKDCYITCSVKCAPPDNKPNPRETLTCSFYLTQELKIFEKAPVFVVLGQFALKALWAQIGQGSLPKFAHGKEIKLEKKTLILSYHPSQQNTFTGRLTESMFDAVFTRSKDLILRARQKSE